jgi:hypothetical protein
MSFLQFFLVNGADDYGQLRYQLSLNIFIQDYRGRI